MHKTIRQIFCSRRFPVWRRGVKAKLHKYFNDKAKGGKTVYDVLNDLAVGNPDAFSVDVGCRSAKEKQTYTYLRPQALSEAGINLNYSRENWMVRIDHHPDHKTVNLVCKDTVIALSNYDDPHGEPGL